MDARAPAMLLGCALSAVIATAATLLITQPLRTTPSAPEDRPLGPAAAPAEAIARMEALTAQLEDLRSRHEVGVSRTPASTSGLATQGEVDALAKRIDALQEAIRDLQSSERKTSLMASLRKKVLATAARDATNTALEQILLNRKKRYGLSELQINQMRELEARWILRDRDLLNVCEGANGSAAMREMARSENEYQAAFVAILTADQREKRKKLINNRGMSFISRYRD